MAWNSYPKSKIAEDAVWNVNKSKSATTYALQYELRRHGYYTTAYLMDGAWGPATCKALQRYLRDKGKYAGKYTGRIDGSMGNMTLQAMCGFVAPDGGNPWNIITYHSWNGPSYWPDYNLTLAWQQFLNRRR